MEKRKNYSLTKRSIDASDLLLSSGAALSPRPYSLEYSDPEMAPVAHNSSDSLDEASDQGFSSPSNKKGKRTIRTYINQHSGAIVLILFLFLLICYFFIPMESFPFLGVTDTDLRSNAGMDHGSVLRDYGKSDYIKQKLKDKDRLDSSNEKEFGVETAPHENPNDELLVQLISEQKKKISAKLAANKAIIPPTEENSNSNNKIPKEEIEKLIEELRTMKQHGTIMEKNVTAIQAIHHLQIRLRKYLIQTYGKDPYYVEMELTFPQTMLDGDNASPDGFLKLQLAPIDLVPYSVYFWIQVVENYKVTKSRISHFFHYFD
jgi:HAMP domain-containing protein